MTDQIIDMYAHYATDIIDIIAYINEDVFVDTNTSMTRLITVVDDIVADADNDLTGQIDVVITRVCQPYYYSLEYKHWWLAYW